MTGTVVPPAEQVPAEELHVARVVPSRHQQPGHVVSGDASLRQRGPRATARAADVAVGLAGEVVGGAKEAALPPRRSAALFAEAAPLAALLGGPGARGGVLAGAEAPGLGEHGGLQARPGVVLAVAGFLPGTLAAAEAARAVRDVGDGLVASEAGTDRDLAHLLQIRREVKLAVAVVPPAGEGVPVANPDAWVLGVHPDPAAVVVARREPIQAFRQG